MSPPRSAVKPAFRLRRMYRDDWEQVLALDAICYPDDRLDEESLHKLDAVLGATTYVLEFGGRVLAYAATRITDFGPPIALEVERLATCSDRRLTALEETLSFVAKGTAPKLCRLDYLVHEGHYAEQLWLREHGWRATEVVRRRFGSEDAYRFVAPDLKRRRSKG